MISKNPSILLTIERSGSISTMRNIEVEIYSKKTHCPNCKMMRGHFDEWQANREDGINVDVEELFIEDNPEIIAESGARSAPIYAITEDDVTTYVGGPQPDVLVDLLNGVDIWD